MLSWDDAAGFSVDMTGDRPRLRIASGVDKSRKARILPLSPDFAQLLLDTPAGQRSGRVFPIIGHYGAPLAVKTIGDTITELGRKAKVVVNQQAGKFASAHDLRRSFGTRWSNLVMPAVLKELMRHNSMETTMKFYVTHQADDLSRELWSKFGPGRVMGEQTGDQNKDAGKKRARRRSS